MIDGAISRGMFLKGGEFPGGVMRKGVSLEEQKLEAERKLLAALKARNEDLRREIEITRLKLSTRQWRREHSL